MRPSPRSPKAGGRRALLRARSDLRMACNACEIIHSIATVVGVGIPVAEGARRPFRPPLRMAYSGRRQHETYKEFVRQPQCSLPRLRR